MHTRKPGRRRVRGVHAPRRAGAGAPGTVVVVRTTVLPPNYDDDDATSCVPCVYVYNDHRRPRTPKTRGLSQSAAGTRYYYLHTAETCNIILYSFTRYFINSFFNGPRGLFPLASSAPQRPRRGGRVQNGYTIHCTLYRVRREDRPL